MLQIPKIIIIFFLIAFDSTCFCSLTWLSINALLWLILYFIFLYCCQTRKLFFATVYSKKMTSFFKQRKENQNENILLKWRALLSHSSFVFLFYILWYFYIFWYFISFGNLVSFWVCISFLNFGILYLLVFLYILAINIFLWYLLVFI